MFRRRVRIRRQRCINLNIHSKLLRINQIVPNDIICTGTKVSLGIIIGTKGTYPLALRSGKPLTFPELLKVAEVNGGGWFVRKLVTASD